MVTVLGHDGSNHESRMSTWLFIWPYNGATFEAIY